MVNSPLVFWYRDVSPNNETTSIWWKIHLVWWDSIKMAKVLNISIFKGKMLICQKYLTILFLLCVGAEGVGPPTSKFGKYCLIPLTLSMPICNKKCFYMDSENKGKFSKKFLSDLQTLVPMLLTRGQFSFFKSWKQFVIF